jgi:hypothetical protein
MNSTALLMMAITFGIVILVTGFYFYKAFTTPSQPVDDGMPEVITKPDFT